MIWIVLVLLAVGLIVWWVTFTIRTFATICRCLWQAALGVGAIVRILWRMVTAPRCPDLLSEFLEKRRGSARH
jgi:hypothetical protein